MVDSIYFGSFFKKDGEYICVHDTSFQPILNSENVESKSDLELEHVSVNIKAIAQVCGSSPDQVSNFLGRMKDFSFNFTKEKKRTICLNLSLGQMMLYPN